MRIGVLGGDGYCGWATALYLSARAFGCDRHNFARRQWDHELGVQTLPSVLRCRAPAHLASAYRQGHRLFVGDVTDHDFLASVIRDDRPEAVVHFAEQRSAPYSMIDRKHAVFTQVNNVVGTLNLLFAHAANSRPIATWSSSARWANTARRISISKKATSRSSTTAARIVLPFPETAGLVLSPLEGSRQPQHHVRLQDLGLRATDLNQGVVYGTLTDEIALDEALINRFDYDEVFGTVLNRFCVQAAVGHPLTVYGKGGQTRGFSIFAIPCAASNWPA